MVRKKSKYRHISIGKRKYYFYHIIWEDILGDSSHFSYNEFEKMKPAVMNTYAYVFKKDKSIYGHLLVMMKKPLVIVMSFLLVA